MALRSRKWLLTIFTNDYINKDFDFFSVLTYQVVIVSPLHTIPSEHFHIIIQHNNAISFDVLKKKFPFAHIEQQFGTNIQAYEYLFHKNDKDKEPLDESDIKSNIDLKSWLQDKENTKDDIGKQILEDIETCGTLWEVIKKNPSFWRDVSKIKDLWFIYKLHEFRTMNPNFDELKSKEEVEAALRAEKNDLDTIL